MIILFSLAFFCILIGMIIEGLNSETEFLDTIKLISIIVMIISIIGWIVFLALMLNEDEDEDKDKVEYRDF